MLVVAFATSVSALTQSTVIDKELHEFKALLDRKRIDLGRPFKGVDEVFEILKVDYPFPKCRLPAEGGILDPHGHKYEIFESSDGYIVILGRTKSANPPDANHLVVIRNRVE
jgi:hypothetical protein